MQIHVESYDATETIHRICFIFATSAVGMIFRTGVPKICGYSIIFRKISRKSEEIHTWRVIFRERETCQKKSHTQFLEAYNGFQSGKYLDTRYNGFESGKSLDPRYYNDGSWTSMGLTSKVPKPTASSLFSANLTRRRLFARRFRCS